MVEKVEKSCVSGQKTTAEHQNNIYAFFCSLNICNFHPNRTLSFQTETNKKNRIRRANWVERAMKSSLFYVCDAVEKESYLCVLKLIVLKTTKLQYSQSILDVTENFQKFLVIKKRSPNFLPTFNSKFLLILRNRC